MEKLPFFVTYLDKSQFYYQDESTLHLQLPDLQTLQQVTISPRNWNKSLKQDGLIWAKGGGSYLFNNQWIPLVQKSQPTPISQGELDILIGLSDNRKELYNPILLIRELFQKLLIFNDEHQLALPLFTESNANINVSDLNQIVSDTIFNAAFASGHKFNQTVFLKAELCDHFYDHSLIISYGDERKKFKGLFYLDTENIALNFLSAVFINLPKPIFDYRFIDAETSLINSQLVNLNRRIYFYDIKKNCILDGELKENKDYNNLRLTNNADFFISKMRKTVSNLN